VRCPLSYALPVLAPGSTKTAHPLQRPAEKWQKKSRSVRMVGARGSLAGRRSRCRRSSTQYGGSEMMPNRQLTQPTGTCRIGHTGGERCAGTFATRLKTTGFVLGVSDKNYTVVGQAPVMSVQRNDLQPSETGWQWCMLYGGVLWVRRFFVSYSGRRVVWYLGHQPTGFFGCKLNLHRGAPSS
jgi:hypothetical protein